jgi:hypothetical protein
MKVPYQTGAGISRAVRGSTGVEIEAELPAVIQPTLNDIGDVLNDASSTADAQTVTSTFMLNVGTNVGATSAAADVLAAFLGRGYWDLIVRLTYHSDFTLPPNTGNFGRLDTRDPAGVTRVLLGFPTIANLYMQEVLNYRLLIAADAWEIRYGYPATGAAQTLTIAVFVYGRKLL